VPEIGRGSKRLSESTGETACAYHVKGLEVTAEALAAAVRRSFLRGLALERRQGYSKAEYALPAEVFESPNLNIKLPRIATLEIFGELERRVWEVFDPELEEFLS
jgi:aldehyde:ferredoxin oxidoreductase